jgi:hypothetical protein
MQYRGVTANDERKATKALDAVSDPHWQLLLQVPATFLQEKREKGPEGLAKAPEAKGKYGT